MNCPKCGGAMEHAHWLAIDVDRCTSCRGIWFDAKELEKLRELPGSDELDIGDESAGHEMNSVRDIRCPRCEVGMTPAHDSHQVHVQYEQCPRCGGTFLDAGELRDLKHHTLGDMLKRFVAHFRHRHH